MSIVKSQQPLPEETPSVTLPISELGSKQINLSKHKWKLHQGAASLLAPGSIIADEYREFEERLENVDLEVVATRSLGERSAKQTIIWQSAIRKPLKNQR
ncbi:MAG: hypothetical protein ACRAVC_15800 [Trichormus sp.]